MASPSLQNVLVIGLGSLGSPMLTEFVNSKSKFNVHLLTTKDPSDPALTEHKNQGVTVHKGNYKDKASLVSILKGIDVVICTLNGPAIEDQITIIDASIEAGVKRFYPSEFASDTLNEETKNTPLCASKVKVAEYIIPKAKEGKITYTFVITGAFPEWGWSSGLLGFDIKNRSATIYGDGNNVTVYSTLKSISRYVVASVLNPSVSENQVLYVSDFEVTQNELLAEFEKATSTKWSTKTLSLEDVNQTYKDAFAKGDYQTGFLNNILAITYGPNGHAKKVDNSKFPDVKRATLAEAVQEAVQSVV